jgi:hypothetical protein
MQLRKTTCLLIFSSWWTTLMLTLLTPLIALSQGWIITWTTWMRGCPAWSSILIVFRLAPALNHDHHWIHLQIKTLIIFFFHSICTLSDFNYWLSPSLQHILVWHYSTHRYRVGMIFFWLMIAYWWVIIYSHLLTLFSYYYVMMIPN